MQSGYLLAGRYQILDIIGVGGMATVYRGREEGLNREVAVKVVASHLAIHPDYVERFNREAQTIATLQHPNIIQIYYYGVEVAGSFVVMPLLKGGTLMERMRQSRKLISIREVGDLALKVGSALHHAHEVGIIHRDIKFSNIMFDNGGNPYVMDFGIARMMDTTQLTATGGHVGTPQFMAPEQWRGNITPAVDQYALAVVLYELLSGKRPFEGTTSHELMYQHLEIVPLSVDVHREDTPPRVVAALNRALSKNSDERYPTMETFAEAFHEACQEAPAASTNFFRFPLQVIPSQSSSGTPGTPILRGATPVSSVPANPSQAPEPAKASRQLPPLAIPVTIVATILVLAFFAFWLNQASNQEVVSQLTAVHLTSEKLAQDSTAQMMAMAATQSVIETVTPIPTVTRINTVVVISTVALPETPIATETLTLSVTPSATATATTTPTATNTATITPSQTSTATNTATATASNTAEPPTVTRSITNTPLFSAADAVRTQTALDILTLTAFAYQPDISVEPQFGTAPTTYSIMVAGMHPNSDFVIQIIHQGRIVFSRDYQANANGEFTLPITSGTNDVGGNYDVEVVQNGNVLDTARFNVTIPTATSTIHPAATRTPRPVATRTPIPAATRTPRPANTRPPHPTATWTPRPTATTDTRSCEVRRIAPQVPMFVGPSSSRSVRGSMPSEWIEVTGQARDADDNNTRWYRILPEDALDSEVDRYWVRQADVEARGNCTDVPFVEGSPIVAGQPVTDRGTTSPASDNGHAPEILSYNIRRDTSSGSLILYKDMVIRDLDGDASLVINTVVATNMTNYQVRNGTVNASVREQRQGATVVGTWRCGGTGYITLQTVVVDARGNRSNPLEFTYNCG